MIARALLCLATIGAVLLAGFEFCAAITQRPDRWP